MFVFALTTKLLSSLDSFISFPLHVFRPAVYTPVIFAARPAFYICRMYIFSCLDPQAVVAGFAINRYDPPSSTST